MKQFIIKDLEQPILKELVMEEWEGMLTYHQNPRNVILERIPYELTWKNHGVSWIVVFDEHGDCYGVMDGMTNENEQKMIDLLNNTDMNVKLIMEFIEL